MNEGSKGRVGREMEWGEGGVWRGALAWGWPWWHFMVCLGGGTEVTAG